MCFAAWRFGPTSDGRSPVAALRGVILRGDFSGFWQASVASLFGRRPTLAVVLSWADLNHWLATNVLGIRTKVDGVIPTAPI